MLAAPEALAAVLCALRAPSGHQCEASLDHLWVRARQEDQEQFPLATVERCDEHLGRRFRVGLS